MKMETIELKATNSAQFFLQDEYRQINLGSDRLFISSSVSEERIPFSVWNGKLTVERGLLWGSITFYSHSTDGKAIAWHVQGLPWYQCKSFARSALKKYQTWYEEQCIQLNKYLPIWVAELELLIKKPEYLADSSLLAWKEVVSQQLETLNMSLEEAKQKMPQAMTAVSMWLEKTDLLVDERNDHWLEQERQNWTALFSQIESSPLNLSQQQAALLNNDYNLVLAGAGTGKTSVLTSRVSYLLQSRLAQADELLLLAFGRDAAREMQNRLNDKIGISAEKATVCTFHQLGLQILKSVESDDIIVSPLATDDKLRKSWCSEWLKAHWENTTNYKRWQKHLSNWPIAYLKGDEELIGQIENPKLIAWIMKQLDQLCMCHLTKRELQQNLIEHSDYTRINSELALVWPCYQAWQKMLKEQGHIDFYTMITKATAYVKSGKFSSSWRYVMVDEYQDISPDRLALLESLSAGKNAKTQASLFAVGDDWQSIYQFAGSDVDLTIGFAERFPSSTIHFLDTSYRFNSMIAEVANQFIQKNPNQIEKEIESYKAQKQKAVYVLPMVRMEKTLDELNQKQEKQVSVLILGRNHYHKPTLFTDWKKRFPKLELSYMTCHGSKGTESDYVFIVGVDEGQFPSVERQPHLDAVLTGSSECYPFAEERRLFYVALTRAKEKVWVVHGNSPSCFVQELINEDYAIVQKR